jgi:uncharacterized protein YbbK (DUF523 family)
LLEFLADIMELQNPTAEYRNVWAGTCDPVCPEQLGGLTTPRIPADITGEKVVSKNGVDVTAQFNKGAQITLEIAKLYDCREAILKSRSPSCGKIDGITAKLLKKNGIIVKTEEEL